MLPQQEGCEVYHAINRNEQHIERAVSTEQKKEETKEERKERRKEGRKEKTHLPTGGKGARSKIALFVAMVAP